MSDAVKTQKLLRGMSRDLVKAEARRIYDAAKAATDDPEMQRLFTTMGQVAGNPSYTQAQFNSLLSRLKGRLEALEIVTDMGLQLPRTQEQTAQIKRWGRALKRQPTEHFMDTGIIPALPPMEGS